MTTHDYPSVLTAWETAQDDFVAKREQYRIAWARAYSDSDAKTDTARKAAADIATSELRLTRDKAETRAAACWQHWLAERGRLEDSRQPGRNGGDGQ